MNDGAVRVAEHLHLDVAPIHDRFFKDEFARPERARRLRACCGDCLGEIIRVRHEAHSAPATAGRRLHHHRDADAPGLGDQRRVGLIGTLVTRHARHAGRDHHALGGGFVAHRVNGVRRRPDEDESGGRARAREVGILRQKPIAGVNRVRARGLRSREQRRDIEVAVARGRRTDAHRLVGLCGMQRALVGVRIHSDGAIAHRARGADDAAGDLAPVGDENLREGGHRLPPPARRRAGVGVESSAARPLPACGHPALSEEGQRFRWRVYAADRFINASSLRARCPSVSTGSSA